MDTGHNCFVLKASDGLPTAGGASSDPPPTSDAWNASGAQPKGGYTTWVRAVAQLSEPPYAWIDVTGQVTWNVLDPDATGTTVDPGGRVTTGGATGTVRFGASLGPTTSPSNEATLTVTGGVLSNLRINPANDVDADDPNSSSFGPDPIFVPRGAYLPAGVTGTFIGPDGGDHCITSDTTLSSNNPAVSTVDAGGTVTGVSQGTATVTARRGATLSDTIPVNVGPHEVVYVEISPAELEVGTGMTGQLRALAHYTDGDFLDVTFDDDTSWYVDMETTPFPDQNTHVTVGHNGLVSVEAGLPDRTADVGACFVSDFIPIDGGPPGQGMTCSDEGRNEGPVSRFSDPITGLAASDNATVTIASP